MTLAPSAATCGCSHANARFFAGLVVYRVSRKRLTVVNMANGVFHTGYNIEINLSRPDLGHPDRPGLLEEINQPISERSRTLLQCLTDRAGGRCQCTLADKSPWMFVRRQRREGQVVLVAAHLPLTHVATPAETERRKAMNERIARAAAAHGLTVSTNVRSADGLMIGQVLVSGAEAQVGWTAQYSPISESTVYRRTAHARQNTVTALWVTPDAASPVIDRAPWARVDDVPWQRIASRLPMLIRGGVRHLQIWKCTPRSERPCPNTGQACGSWHCGWFLPALCIPQERATSLDELIVTSADGEHQIVRTRDPASQRSISHLWALASDVQRWQELTGLPSGNEETDPPVEEEPLTFTGEDIDRSCRYGDERPHKDAARPRRDRSSATGILTLDTEPTRPQPAPNRPVQLRLSPNERRVVAAQLRCAPWDVGPCMLCASPINRYSSTKGALTCTNCRSRGYSRP
ncbi:hypothetical protein AB0M57_11240 [Streptomyces sp. NPDC051597]|uniref:hypothetical protein n=1 Tax=Streptomyces sp. NPDC051597 TaxID=3155049 RepID=UPI003440F764